MRRIDHATKELEELVSQWEGLKKNKSRRTETQIANEEAFTNCFNDLFDVAHQDALTTMDNEEDKQFLQKQREKGRQGSMVGADLLLMKKQKRQARKRHNQQAWKEKQNATFDQVVVLESSDSSNSSSDSEAEGAVGGVTTTPTPPANKRGRTNLFTSHVLSSIDRAKISDRRAVQLISPIMHASEYSINRSSIRRYRLLHRTRRAAELKAEFRSLEPLVLHWDGKLMGDLTSDEKVDRLPIIVSGSATEQLLCIPKLPSGTGQAMADALIETVIDWDIKDRIKALSFDTTSSNTGIKSGACVLIEKLLEHKVLYLACRYHIHEILLEEAFSITMGPSSGPEIQLFKRFKIFWPSIVTADYKPGIGNPAIAAAIPNISDVKNFVTSQLELTHKRADYRELLELSLVFLGGVPSRGVTFMKPGAIHRARFMAWLMYALKIFIFRDAGFKLTNRERDGLGNFCVFGVSAYVKSCFLSQLPTSAPAGDLRLLKLLIDIGSPSSLGANKETLRAPLVPK